LNERRKALVAFKGLLGEFAKLHRKVLSIFEGDTDVD
jgi:hypothetical protein